MYKAKLSRVWFPVTAGIMATSASDPVWCDDPLLQCPQCGGLCLGPCTLPCGHLACRSCLRPPERQRQPLSACGSCGARLSVRGDLQPDQQFGSDPVMHHLTIQYLGRQVDGRCVECTNVKATKVCQDCHVLYCDRCSALHSRNKASADHVLQLLPQAYHNTSSDGRPPPRPRSHRRHTQLGDTAPHGLQQALTHWDRSLQQEMLLLQQADSQHDKMVAQVEHILQQGQQLLQKVKRQKRLIQQYKEELPAFRVFQRTETEVYVRQRTQDDDMLVVKTQWLQKRMCEVRAEPTSPQLEEAEAVSRQLHDMLQGLRTGQCHQVLIVREPGGPPCTDSPPPPPLCQ